MIVSASLSSCILEEQDSEYDVLGGVATIATWVPSKTNPTAEETISIKALYYSEHAPVQELRFFAKVGAADRVLVQTVPVSSFDTQDSYEQEFSFSIPAGTPAATVIVLTIEAETPNTLVKRRSTPASGAGTIIVI